MFSLLLVLRLAGPGDHPGGDSWFGVDKVKHFFIGAFVQSVGYNAVRLTGADHKSSLWAATAITAGVSIGKEWWDGHAGGTPSLKDLAWDAAGAGASTLLLQHSVR
jgi:putative lipoprotein